MGRFYMPTQVITGTGCFGELGATAARHGRRALLVCGRSLQKSGRLAQATEGLRDAGVEVVLYDAIIGEPTLSVVQKGLELARREEIEVVIGIGGGSAMDTAKAIAGLYDHPGTVAEYFDGQREINGRGRPWVAVPTTAGTGAEVTKNAVLMSPERKRKASLRHESWFAAAALVDPELTLTVPPQVTAASGSDALVQAIESYTSIGATPITDALATEAIARIGRALERAYRNGQDLEARADMLYGSTLAGMALTNARLGGVHGMAHPLGCRYHIPHGVVCGLLMPHVMEYNLEYATSKYAQVARLLGVDTRGMSTHQAAQKAVARVRELIAAVGIPAHLADLGVTTPELAVIAQESLPSGSLKHNPRPLSAADIERILTAAL